VQLKRPGRYGGSFSIGNFERMKISLRKLSLSLMLVIVWLGFIVGGSHALFGDAASLSGNVITTGTANLLISNSQGSTYTQFDDSRPGFDYNLIPGQEESRYFVLKNGSASNVTFDISVSVIGQNTTPEVLSFVTLKFVPVDDAGNETGPVVSFGMTTYGSTVVPLGVQIPAGGVQRMKAITGLSSASTAQGKTIMYDLVFTGVQKISS
jgi:hypothetical protein